MDISLQTAMERIQSHPNISEDDRTSILQLLKEADKKLAISEFKLDRTEKVKRTTAILLEETIEELELKRKAIEETNVALQKSLEELKAAQAQLVQAEKMASLGELTAGIAHEIQNPLNFVNNFSEVSKELVEEMNDELAIGNYDLAKEIASDIEQNLVKILHHGKRADSIVKGMLQHSRTSSGQKELTDINVLAEEYLRLSYHGLKSKIKDFNTSLKTELDPGIQKLSIVPQDIGRVILNLINNAFYAVHEKSKLGIAEYMPTVTLKTHAKGNLVEISVADNGNGIPENIKEKIFQPFFTTKPTGEGTGLGLSLSYDIIKAHGGELTVKSQPAGTNLASGTEFIFTLPNH
jgi:two-component system, NtrC family, sensor kinase